MEGVRGGRGSCEIIFGDEKVSWDKKTNIFLFLNVFCWTFWWYILGFFLIFLWMWLNWWGGITSVSEVSRWKVAAGVFWVFLKAPLQCAITVMTSRFTGLMAPKKSWRKWWQNVQVQTHHLHFVVALVIVTYTLYTAVQYLRVIYLWVLKI